jgi:hypothetical protein
MQHQNLTQSRPDAEKAAETRFHSAAWRLRVRFVFERLLRFANRLGQDVQIRLEPARRRRQGSIDVTAV